MISILGAFLFCLRLGSAAPPEVSVRIPTAASLLEDSRVDVARKFQEIQRNYSARERNRGEIDLVDADGRVVGTIRYRQTVDAAATLRTEQLELWVSGYLLFGQEIVTNGTGLTILPPMNRVFLEGESGFALASGEETKLVRMRSGEVEIIRGEFYRTGVQKIFIGGDEVLVITDRAQDLSDGSRFREIEFKLRAGQYRVQQFGLTLMRTYRDDLLRVQVLERPVYVIPHVTYYRSNSSMKGGGGKLSGLTPFLNAFNDMIYAMIVDNGVKRYWSHPIVYGIFPKTEVVKTVGQGSRLRDDLSLLRAQLDSLSSSPGLLPIIKTSVLSILEAFDNGQLSCQDFRP